MTLDDLTTPLTVAQARAAIYAAIEARGASTTSWKSGSVVRTMISGLAIVLAAFSRLQALIAKSGFLALAEGDWLTLVALHVYGVERDLGSFASGYVTLTNSGGGVYSGDAGDLVFYSTTSLKSYRSTEAYSLGAMGTATVTVEAIEIGSDSNVSATGIDTLVTTLSGVTCSNAAALAGTDVETDAALRIRCYEKTGSLSPNGPPDAYAYVAKSAKKADGVTPVGVTRVRTTADGTGHVDVYVGTASGGVTGTMGDPATDLGAVNLAIQTQAVPVAVDADTLTAVAKSIAVTSTLYVLNTSGKTDDELEAAVVAALDAFIESQPIAGLNIAGGSGFVYRQALMAVIGGANPTAPTIQVVMATPAADVAIDSDEVPVPGAHAITVVQVAGGLL